jgi:hypothetical protein
MRITLLRPAPEEPLLSQLELLQSLAYLWYYVYNRRFRAEAWAILKRLLRPAQPEPEFVEFMSRKRCQRRMHARPRRHCDLTANIETRFLSAIASSLA